MPVISVIVGSTREGRFSEKPAHWILQHLKKREGVGRPASRPARLSDAVLRSASTAGHAGSPRLTKARFVQEMDRRDRAIRRLSSSSRPNTTFGPSAVLKERDRLGLSRMESQGGRLS